MDSSPSLQAIQLKIIQQIEQAGAEVAVALRSFSETHFLYHNENMIFHAASTMKIAVMLEVFSQVESGKIALTDRLETRNLFKSVIDGSAYSLELEYDEEQIASASTRTISQLCEAMITVSSNLATNLLIQHVGVENIQACLRSIRADSMQVLRGLEDTRAFESGLSNTTTAKALLIQLEALANHQFLTPTACDAMIAILKRQEWVDAIPAGVRSGTVVANKTGEITGIHHDAAIVYADIPYVLVILTRGIDNREDSAHLIANITRIIDVAIRQL